MIVAISRFQVARDASPLLQERFRDRSGRVDGFPGFLGLEVLLSPAGAKVEFVLITRWADRRALKAYLRSEEFRAVHANGEEQQATFATYELVAT